MAVVDLELSQLWGRVVDHVSAGEPQHRAFLAMTKPLGLLQKEGGATSLLVAAPNAFAKDVLESRLRTVINDVLTAELGKKANIAVMVDETIELADLPAPTVLIESATPRPGTGREEEVLRRNDEPTQLNAALSANVNSVTVGKDGILTLNLAGIGPVKMSEVKQFN